MRNLNLASIIKTYAPTKSTVYGGSMST